MTYFVLAVVAIVALCFAVVALAFFGIVWMLTRSNRKPLLAASDGRNVSDLPPSNSSNP